MEHVFDRYPNLLPQVADENSNLQTSTTVDTTNRRDLSQASKADSKFLKSITYLRRSKKVGHNRRKKGHNSSTWNLQKNGFCNNDSSMVESAETGFGRKKNNDASFGDDFLTIDGKQNGSVKEGTQADPASKVSMDSDSNKVKTFGSATNKWAKWRGWKKKKEKKTFILASEISLSEKGVSGSMETENIDSVKKNDLHPEIPSKSEMKKKNNINQTMSVEEENDGLRRNATIVAVNQRNLPQSPKYTLKTPALKYTCTKRHYNSGEQGRTPHHCSYLNSQVNEHDPVNRSLSIIDAAEVSCERKEDANASFRENILHVDERDGVSSTKHMQTSPTSIISSDINSKFHEVNRMHSERIIKPRWRKKKKNKTRICSTLMPIREKDVSGSMKSEIIDSVERDDLDSEICSKYEMGNVKLNSGKIHARRRHRAKKETATVGKDDSLDIPQLCDILLTLSEPKNEDLCQLKCGISIEEKSNRKDDDMCPSPVQDVTNDVTSDATMKENITLNNMTTSLHRGIKQRLDIRRWSTEEKKEIGENFKLLPPTSAQTMEHVFDKCPNLLPQVADENSNLQTSNTVVTTNRRDLSQASKADSKFLKLITYLRRFKKVGHNRRKKGHNSSTWNLQKNGFFNNDSSMVESAETGFGRKKNNDASFGDDFLTIDGKQNGSVKEGTQADPASKVSLDSDSNKVKSFGSATNKRAKCRGGRKKKKNKTFIPASQISVSEKEVIGSVETENIDSVKNNDLHPEIPSKSVMKKKNNINQTMSAEEENDGLRRNATIVAVNQSILPQSPKYTLKTPALKYTYTKRCNSGEQRRTPHNCSYLNSQVNENDPVNRSLSIIDAAEAACERKEDANASFRENILHVDEKDSVSSTKNMQTSPTSIISSDINSKFHEVNRMHSERIKKPRCRKNKKNKTAICSTPMPIGEKDVSGSMKSEIIDSVERDDLDSEICSKSEMGNVQLNSGKIHARRNRAKKKTATVGRDDSLDILQVCDILLTLSEPKNEDLCQPKCGISIEEKSNSKDDDMCPSPVQDVTNDVTSDATMKENISLNNISTSLQRASISSGKKKLLVLDLNGLLVDVIFEHHTFRRAPIKVAGKSVYKRPFCEEFLEFCFERFDVGVWSSRKRKNIDAVVNFLFGEKRRQLLFCWDLSMCTTTGFNTLENVHKPLVLKELKKLWNKEDADLPWEKGDYSSSNTLLIDDSPYKALSNPPHTAVFPSPYDHRNENDNALGLEGVIRVYLKGLAMANDVRSYVKEHQFGQKAIMPGNPYWRLYLQIVEKMNPSLASACSY